MQDRDPLVSRQSAIWRTHDEAALKHEELSTQGGNGAEHQFPIPYSHVGAGTAEVHCDVNDMVVDVLKVLDEIEVMVEMSEEDVDVL